MYSLEKVHQRGTIHRDLKPLNIFFDANGEAYLGDFGIARLAENNNSTASIGTPRYMAPEQFGEDPLTIQTDIYQMGIILFEMLTGKTPFDASTHAAIINKVISDPVPSVREFNAKLTPTFDALFRIAMAKKAEDRYEKATDLAKHFTELATNRTSSMALFLLRLRQLKGNVKSIAKGIKTKMLWFSAILLFMVLVLMGVLFAQQLGLDEQQSSTTIIHVTEQADVDPSQRDFTFILVTATAVPGSQTIVEESEIPIKPTVDFGATETAEAFTIEIQNLHATQTRVAQPTAIITTSTSIPSSTPIFILGRVSPDVFAGWLGESIVVDGDLGEWPFVPAIASTHIVYQDENWDGSEDLDVNWQLTWDNAYLYLGVTVIDDIHVQTQTGNQIFKGDSVSLQIDVDRSGDLSEHVSPDDFQIDISPGDFATIAPSAHRFRGTEGEWMNNAPGHAIFVQAQQTDVGYILEVALPWADLDMTPFDGKVLGLALSATDNDTPDTAVQELFVSNVAEREFNNPSSLGTLTLQGNLSSSPNQATAIPSPNAVSIRMVMSRNWMRYIGLIALGMK